MKSLLAIYRRYIFSAGWIAALVIVVNIAVFCCAGIYLKVLDREGMVSGSRGVLSQITSCFVQQEDGVEMTEEGYAILEKNKAAFALLLDGNGKRIWGWQVPEEIPDRFTVGEVAAFTRWYLQDYPVRVWNCDAGLFVYAWEKGSVAKYTVEAEGKSIRNLPWMFLVMVTANFLLVLLLAMLSGYRMYASLRPVAYGIDGLASGKRRMAPEHGVTGELGRKLNQASEILEEQRRNLERRDTARTEWISGVSHDIRTPLSMVMGYADNLENDDSLPEEARKEAAIIKEQSVRIKMLIEDLNLTSKLEYHMQPVRAREYMPAALVRSAVVSVLNGGLPEGYELDVDISEALEGVSLYGDWNLLSRALHNLIGNSIRHNAACHIRVEAGLEEHEGQLACSICVIDDGAGIPEGVRGLLDGGGREGEKAEGRSQGAERCSQGAERRSQGVKRRSQEAKRRSQEAERRSQGAEGSSQGTEGHAQPPHVMGLRIVKQIMQAHGGEMRILADGKKVALILPVSKERAERKENWWEILWYGKGGYRRSLWKRRRSERE